MELALDPPFVDLARDGRWDDYARRLGDDGLAWWFDMEVPRIAAHFAAIPEEHTRRLAPRLLLLQATFAPLPEGRDPRQALRDLTLLYRLLQVRRDREGMAAACCLACAAICDFGTDLATVKPWRRRMAGLLKGARLPPRPRAALLAFDAHFCLFHEGDPTGALTTLDHQRMAAEAASSAAQALYGATLQGIALTWRGEPERAALLLEDAAPLLGPPKSSTMVDGKRVATFWLHRALDRPVRQRQLLRLPGVELLGHLVQPVRRPDPGVGLREPGGWPGEVDDLGHRPVRHHPRRLRQWLVRQPRLPADQ